MAVSQPVLFVHKCVAYNIIIPVHGCRWLAGVWETLTSHVEAYKPQDKPRRALDR